MLIRFILVAEGGAEGELVPHLRRICVAAGADEALGSFPDLRLLAPGNRVEDKLDAVLALNPDVDLVFVHRDAEGRDATPVRDHVRAALNAIGRGGDGVQVVPVQEFEAWLLVDEQAIRSVVGKPDGRLPLGLPSLGSIERTARPKEFLQRALATASESSGRRLKAVKRDFNDHRRILAQRLDPDGPIMGLPSWRQLVVDTTAAVGTLIAP